MPLLIFMARVFKSNKPKLTFGVKGNGEKRKAPTPSKKGKISTPRFTHQTGEVKDILRDASRKALLPGKRISKTGKVYYESRRNRSDAFKSNL